MYHSFFICSSSDGTWIISRSRLLSYKPFKLLFGWIARVILSIILWIESDSPLFRENNDKAIFPFVELQNIGNVCLLCSFWMEFLVSLNITTDYSWAECSCCSRVSQGESSICMSQILPSEDSTSLGCLKDDTLGFL